MLEKHGGLTFVQNSYKNNGISAVPYQRRLMQQKHYTNQIVWRYVKISLHMITSTLLVNQHQITLLSSENDGE